LAFDVVNVSKFSARPRTSAQKLKPLPSDEVADRSRTVSRLWKNLALAINRQWIGWRGYVLVDETGTNGTQIGRTDTYKPVVIGGKESLLGKRMLVEVADAWPTYLVGNRIE
jgi:tRNA A37 methylthiotransferase MiaB